MLNLKGIAAAAAATTEEREQRTKGVAMMIGLDPKCLQALCYVVKA